MHGLNTYDYGARQYNPVTAHWDRVDPLAEKYYGISPYAYCLGNPIRFIDPDGCSTWVKRIGEGQYEIIGGDLKDKDLNIYVYTQDDNGEYTMRGQSIGITATITSFYSSDDKGGQWQTGNIINTNDYSGNQFLQRIVNNTPTLDNYIVNARNGRRYDFKETNGQEGGNNYKHYRGMPIGVSKNKQTVFASGRDVGNIAAGYVAAANDMDWIKSRMAFDAYQSYSSKKFTIEGRSTFNAEHLGWYLGYKNTNYIQKKINLVRSLIHPFTHFIFNE